MLVDEAVVGGVVALVVRRPGVGSVLDEELDNLLVVVLARQDEKGISMVVSGINGNALFQHRLLHLRVMPVPHLRARRLYSSQNELLLRLRLLFPLDNLAKK